MHTPWVPSDPRLLLRGMGTRAGQTPSPGAAPWEGGDRPRRREAGGAGSARGAWAEQGPATSARRFADQRGARAAFAVSFLAASALYLLLAAACSPALPGAALLFASRLPAPFMHTLPGRRRAGPEPLAGGGHPKTSVCT